MHYRNESLSYTEGLLNLSKSTDKRLVRSSYINHFLVLTICCRPTDYVQSLEQTRRLSSRVGYTVDTDNVEC